MNDKTLDEASKSIRKLLNGKDVARIYLITASEICIEFSDKTRLFINSEDNTKLDFSISGGNI